MKLFPAAVTVDSILEQFYKQMDALAKLADAKRTESEQHYALAAEHEVAAGNCLSESVRADAVRAKIAAMVD